MRIHHYILFILLVLNGCANYPSALDDNFGAAVRQAISDQTVNPDASLKVRPPAQTEAQSVKSSIDRYQKSIEVPPLPTNVFNIGVGSGAGSGAH